MMERAAAVSVLWETEEVMATFFDGPHAASRADAFLEAVGDDFPGAYHVTVANPEAAEVRADDFMRRLT
jgi:hypothetical protein